MDSTQDLKDHTVEKLKRLTRFESQEMSIHTVFSVEKFHKTVEFSVNTNGHTFVAHDTANDMYEAIDLAFDKLDRQLSRDKSKRKHHKGLQGSTPNVIE
jgi:ribosomal subunit interface protein